MKILLTGLPGCGKTTVIQKVLSKTDRRAKGIYTAEIREAGRRVGFTIQNLLGEKEVMSHVNIRSRHRVGRYGVDVNSLEKIALPALSPSDRETLVIVDEIGKMECFSKAFFQKVRLLLDGPNPLLGTVARKGGGFPAEARQHPGVELIEVSRENRNLLPAEIISMLLRI